MKLFPMFSQRRAQAVAEYLILLGLVTGLTIWAFDTMLPLVVSGDGNSGYAVTFFHNIVDKIND